MNQFEDMTIGELRILTKEHENIARENKLLKIKYPNKIKEVKEDAQKIIDMI